jgi:hypothetical protein
LGKNANGRDIIELFHHPLVAYEKEWYDAMLENRYIWVKKATGMGATEFFLRYMAWLCLRNDHYKGASMGIVTGPRIDIAIEEIARIPVMFRLCKYKPVQVGAKIWINGCKIQAYPSHTFDSARGIEKVRFWFVDEGDFFPPSQQLKCREIVERYEAKSHPFVIFNSTANLPGGLYEIMEKEPNSQYTKIFSLADKGIRDGIYTEYEIEESKKSTGYMREYMGVYGIGLGDIFGLQSIDDITEPYDLGNLGGARILNVDPAFGESEDASKFAWCGFEKRQDGIKYVVDAGEIGRASTEGMLDFIEKKFYEGKYTTLQVDSAFPGLIRDWQSGSEKTGRRKVNTFSVIFKDVLTQMTTHATSMVQNKEVRIHPKFSDLISQLKSVRYNDKGHPDKKKLSFDMGDTFLMGLHYWDTKTAIRKLKSKF